MYKPNMIMKLQIALVLAACMEIAGCQRNGSGIAQRAPVGSTEAIQLNNRGVAEMNRGRGAQALELFRQAWQRDSSLFPARLNEGIALLNNQRFDEAKEVLLDATRRQPNSARA